MVLVSETKYGFWEVQVYSEMYTLGRNPALMPLAVVGFLFSSHNSETGTEYCW